MSKILMIPVEAGLADQQMDISLENKVFTIRMTWNENSGYWYFTLSQRGGEPIISNIKMVKNTCLIKRYQLDEIKGDFIFFDNNSGKLRPDFYSLGNDHILIYQKSN
jgi:hypothetical protein